MSKANFPHRRLSKFTSPLRTLPLLWMAMGGALGWVVSMLERAVRQHPAFSAADDRSFLLLVIVATMSVVGSLSFALMAEEARRRRASGSGSEPLAERLQVVDPRFGHQFRSVSFALIWILGFASPGGILFAGFSIALDQPGMAWAAVQTTGLGLYVAWTLLAVRELVEILSGIDFDIPGKMFSSGHAMPAAEEPGEPGQFFRTAHHKLLQRIDQHGTVNALLLSGVRTETPLVLSARRGCAPAQVTRNAMLKSQLKTLEESGLLERVGRSHFLTESGRRFLTVPQEYLQPSVPGWAVQWLAKAEGQILHAEQSPETIRAHFLELEYWLQRVVWTLSVRQGGDESPAAWTKVQKLSMGSLFARVREHLLRDFETTGKGDAEPGRKLRSFWPMTERFTQLRNATSHARTSPTEHGMGAAALHEAIWLSRPMVLYLIEFLRTAGVSGLNEPPPASAHADASPAQSAAAGTRPDARALPSTD